MTPFLSSMMKVQTEILPIRDQPGMQIDAMISNIVVGVSTGLISAALSIVTFRAQRQWERKQDAYKEVLQALHEMKSANDVEFQACMENRDLPAPTIKAIHEQWFAGKRITAKYADIGSVVLSVRAVNILQAMGTELDKRTYSTTFDELDNDGYQVGVALKAMKAAAIQDQHRSLLARFRTRNWPG